MRRRERSVPGGGGGSVPRFVTVGGDERPAGPVSVTGHLAGLKAVVRGELGLTADAVVVISELRCADRGCAPVETLVAVLHEGARRVWRLPVPVAEVDLPKLRDLLGRLPRGARA